MKLNGWHRLWILLSAVYFLLVTSYVILAFSKAEDIGHSAEFYKKLSKKSAGMILGYTHEDISALSLARGVVVKEFDYKKEYGTWENYQKVMQERWEKAEPVIPHPFKMPNIHTIEFKPNLLEEDMRIASQEYWRAVKQWATGIKLRFMLYAFLFWLGLCMGLYALGWSINWVYKGFKQKKDAPKNRVFNLDF